MHNCHACKPSSKASVLIYFCERSDIMLEYFILSLCQCSNRRESEHFSWNLNLCKWIPTQFFHSLCLIYFPISLNGYKKSNYVSFPIISKLRKFYLPCMESNHVLLQSIDIITVYNHFIVLVLNIEVFQIKFS